MRGTSQCSGYALESIFGAEDNGASEEVVSRSRDAVSTDEATRCETLPTATLLRELIHAVNDFIQDVCRFQTKDIKLYWSIIPEALRLLECAHMSYTSL